MITLAMPKYYFLFLNENVELFPNTSMSKLLSEYTFIRKGDIAEYVTLLVFLQRILLHQWLKQQK